MSETRAGIETEAEYALEFAVKCSGCQDWIERVGVVRMLRAKINFTSALPRRGRVMVCTKCSTIISAELGGLG
jgi:hypothetical protein